jgi:arginine deiminase
MPNLIFQRDPFASIGTGISLHYMANNTRRRETLFASTVFKYHPDFVGTTKYYDRDQEDGLSLEGGDVMILSDKEIAVGISERSSADAVELLAKNIFADKESDITAVYGISIPKGRA